MCEMLDRLDQILQEYTTADSTSPRGRERLLLPLLQRVQREFAYVPIKTLAPLARFTGLSESQIYGVATFYAHFKFTVPGKHSITVCCGTACHVRGSDRLVGDIQEQLAISPGQTTPDGNVSLETTACFGSCALAPVVVIDGKAQGRMSRTRISKALHALATVAQSEEGSV